ncbi:HAD-IIIC family phosphatase [Ferruginibacter sp. SUN106]|uniref:HAD-IIIC family phosphatase n=1 Tax=Ferruginibacter sp. SUN106 TaxID=2978348 RepID=UPI003D362102
MEFKDLKKLLKNNFSELPVIKVAVLADSASQLFCQALKGYGYTQGIHLDIWEADYDQVYQTVLDADSALYITAPEYVIIYQSSKKLLPSFYKNNLQQKKEFADKQIDFLKTITTTIDTRINTNIIIVNYVEINDAVFGNFANKTDSSFTYQLRKLNVGLMDLAISKPNINICDLAAIQNLFGSNTVVSERLYVNTDNVLDIELLPVLAKNITAIILAYSGRFKKCLILDLDNTTWGGIIGDDGMEGIQIGDLGIGKAFTNFQKWVLQLKERGIILAVCSKNTEHIAKEPFEKHPDMVLKLEDIAVFIANWNNKADNIRHIQSILNIGFDSMVFLDDNPAERAIVRREIPEVTVPELPEDPADYLSFLYQENLFETTSFTEADSKRNEQYREEAGRAVLQQAFTNEAEFLESLEMTAEVKPIDKFTLPRAAQLTQRSNQFNLRTIRYTEEQLKELCNDKNIFTFTVSLKDKFGDYGLISLLILKRTGDDSLFIDTWIMSCRVLKRNVEELALNQLIVLAQKEGCKTVTGEFIPTAKNGLVKNHFENLGFKESGNNLWKMDVDLYTPKSNFIQIK